MRYRLKANKKLDVNSSFRHFEKWRCGAGARGGSIVLIVGDVRCENTWMIVFPGALYSHFRCSTATACNEWMTVSEWSRSCVSVVNNQHRPSCVTWHQLQVHDSHTLRPLHLTNVWLPVGCIFNTSEPTGMIFGTIQRYFVLHTSLLWVDQI